MRTHPVRSLEWSLLTFKRVGIALLLIIVAVPSRSWPQSSANVELESSEPLFGVLAALNAAGYDTGVGAQTGDDTRMLVRAYLMKSQAPVIPDLQKFYSQHHVEGDPGADLGQYLSLALLLGPPPNYDFTVPEGDLPPDVRDLKGFVPLLRTLYGQAKLINLWAQVQPRYDAAVARYTEAVRRSFVLSEAYFRLPAGGYLGRTYTIYIDLLGVPEQVQARTYGLNYYLVVTPSKEPKVHEIRHEYLHFLLEPLAGKYTAEIEQKALLQTIARQAPALPLDFKDDFPLLVTECLIRAAELRMDKRPAAEAEKSLTEMTAEGLVLVRYFYEALADFERQEASLPVYYEQMILNINPVAEEKRLIPVQWTPRPRPQQKNVTSPASELDRLLDQGDSQFFQGKYLEAKASYHEVLERLDAKNERAMYGMAVVYANTRKPDLAEEYFRKVLDTARDLRLVTWSHIYLGRLDDLRGQRDDALAQYHAASLTAGAYPLAWRAVQSGIAEAFGSEPSEKK